MPTPTNRPHVGGCDEACGLAVSPRSACTCPWCRGRNHGSLRSTPEALDAVRASVQAQGAFHRIPEPMSDEIF